MDEKTNNWIKAHIQMFEFFGGVTPMLVPDNCTTAVNHAKSDWYSTALNTTYHEMAEHYNLAIVPARVRKPKDGSDFVSDETIASKAEAKPHGITRGARYYGGKKS